MTGHPQNRLQNVDERQKSEISSTKRASNVDERQKKCNVVLK